MSHKVDIDYNGVIKLIHDIPEDDERVSFRYECNIDFGGLGKKLVKTLTKISSVDDTTNPNMLRLLINGTTFALIDKMTGRTIIINKLTGFETRLLAQNKTHGMPLNREMLTTFRPKTDLHTHFTGAITPEGLIDVGMKNNISIPSHLLERAGINTNKYVVQDNKVLIQSLSYQDIEILKSKLMICPITQETFNNVEEVYLLRFVFTKNPALFEDILRNLAREYQQKGIEYAELAFSDFFNNTDYLKICQEKLPSIEQETGVKIRFLTALRRDDAREKNLDFIDMIKSLSKCPYIVGCDFMGYESNSTEDFAEQLEILTRFAITQKPDFVLRVHAGENPIYKTNVKKALEIINTTYEQIKAETNKSLPLPKVRIGHGLYGIDSEVLRLAKTLNAVIEFNISSNLSLNNINSISEIPIKRYIDGGVKVVLATDGHGIYSTNNEQEVILASNAGLTLYDFDKIKETELNITKTALEITECTLDISELYNFTYSTIDGQRRWTSDVAEIYKTRLKYLENILTNRILEIGASTSDQEIKSITENKIPILIVGASRSSWANVAPQHQEYIKLFMEVLADTLDPEKSYIITGATNFGVVKQVHEAVYKRNSRYDTPLSILGTVAIEAAQVKKCGLEKQTVTHVIIPEINGKKIRAKQEVPDIQLNFLRNNNGILLAIGGGVVTNDMIQRAYNMGDVYICLMKGPYGASTNKSMVYENNKYYFETIEDFMIKLYNIHPQVFKKDFNLNDISKYIEEQNVAI